MSRKKSSRPPIPRFNTPIVETHCHLDYLQPEELGQTLALSGDVGIERIITIAVSPGNLDTVLALARDHSQVWGTQGIHPHEAETYTAEVAARIVSGLAHQRMLAVGEIGLDYHYDHAGRSVQRTVFEQQLQIAVDHGLPVVIHTRDADADTRAILENFSGKLPRKGVIHSFTSSMELAEYCLGEGFYLGFNGIATFNNAHQVRAVVEAAPLQQILLETDTPYLTPVPYRGKPNGPFYLPFIGQCLARVKNCDTERLLEHAYQNSYRLFFPDKLPRRWRVLATG